MLNIITGQMQMPQELCKKNCSLHDCSCSDHRVLIYRALTFLLGAINPSARNRHTQTSIPQDLMWMFRPLDRQMFLPGNAFLPQRGRTTLAPNLGLFPTGILQPVMTPTDVDHGLVKIPGPTGQ